ncbi:MAG: hypothetical protein AAF997_21475 [Myxococcota bacterium]
MAGRKTVAVWFACMVISACGARANLSTPVVRQEFQFQVLDLETPRQYGRTIDILVRYRYQDALPTSEYPDYRAIRRAVLDFVRVRDGEPAEEYWEVLNADLVRHLHSSFPLRGVTSQIRVHPDPNPKLEEPGWHSSIVTLGDIAPLGSCTE